MFSSCLISPHSTCHHRGTAYFNTTSRLNYSPCKLPGVSAKINIHVRSSFILNCPLLYRAGLIALLYIYDYNDVHVSNMAVMTSLINEFRMMLQSVGSVIVEHCDFIEFQLSLLSPALKLWNSIQQYMHLLLNNNIYLFTVQPSLHDR